MRFDLYAELASQTACPTDGSLPAGLASGFVDGCTEWSTRRNNQGDKARDDARKQYLQRASSGGLGLPSWLRLDPSFDRLPDRSWLAFGATFKLKTPWYSKDDRVFHVLDNPVRKDRVFGVPYLAAASWKGLLRWAVEMTAGLIGPNPTRDEQKRKKAKAIVLHLFGNEKATNNEKVGAEDLQHGALVFYPTWFDKIGIEVINPHSRERRAGTQPIYYEVVPACTSGTLRLLYAPLPGAATRDRVESWEAVKDLLEAIQTLLTTYGISAKRTVGWGTASVSQWTARWNGERPIQASELADFKTRVKPWARALEAQRA